jgi:hypothetical protein
MKSCESRENPQMQTKSLGFIALDEPEYIEIPAVESLKFVHGTKNQKVDLYNPKDNKCYFKISIKLSDDTVIFESGQLNPGEKFEIIQLNQPLKRGIYSNCQLIYRCFSLKDCHEQNGSQFKIEIYSN